MASAPNRPTSAPPPRQQSSQTYHTSLQPSNANPFLPPNRPRIDHPSSQPISSGTSISDRVRSMSTSSLAGPPRSTQGASEPESQGADSGSIGETLQRAKTATATAVPAAVEGGLQRGKDMFQWFQDTVVISMIVRNWPS